MPGTKNATQEQLKKKDILSLQLLAGIVRLVMADSQWNRMNRRWGLV